MESLIILLLFIVFSVAVLIVVMKLIIALFPILVAGCILLFVCWIFSAADGSATQNASDKQTVGETHYTPDNSTHYKKYKQRSNTKTVRTRNDEQAAFHEEALTYVYQKNGVNLNTLQPALDSAIIAVVGAFQEVMGPDYNPTVTSGDDYEGHRAQSAHYSGAALDFRLKDIENPEDRHMAYLHVMNALDDRFFVDHEFPGQPNEHLHIQLRKGQYSNVAWK